MDHPTVMYLFKFVMSPIFVVALVALFGLSIVINIQLLKEKARLESKFGKPASEWMVE